MLDAPPALLSALEQLEDHRQGRRLGAAVPAPLGPQADRGDGRLDRVGGADMHPVLCRVVVERQQLVPILGQACHGPGVLGLEAFQGAIEGPMGCFARLSHPDLVKIGLDLGLYRLWQLVQHISRLVDPAALMVSFRVNLAQCRPEPHGTAAYRQLGSRGQAALSQARQQRLPAGRRLAEAILDGHQFLAAMLGDADDHQQAQAVIHADVAVDSVGPPVDVAPVGQVPLPPLGMLVFPLLLEP